MIKILFIHHKLGLINNCKIKEKNLIKNNNLHIKILVGFLDKIQVYWIDKDIKKL